MPSPLCPAPFNTIGELRLPGPRSTREGSQRGFLSGASGVQGLPCEAGEEARRGNRSRGAAKEIDGEASSLTCSCAILQRAVIR
jgi:hypothetical protein